MTDRVIVYPQAIPQSADVLRTARYTLVGQGYQALDILGNNTLASGFACTPTSPASLSVVVAPGRLYSPQNVDNTAYSGLPADTAHLILKQGISPDALTVSCPAPATFGFSINYLIQVAYQDLDTDNVTLPYYNVANPNIALSGPNNSGTAQATTRKGTVVLSAKPGTAATSGTQTTPAPDAGAFGLWVVTVANGATQITAGNIVMYSAAPLASGSSTLTLTGCTSAPTTNFKWMRSGPQVLGIIQPVNATSNSTTCSLTGVPSALWPLSTQVICAASLLNASVTTAVGGLEIDGSGVIQLILNATATGFQNSGQKGIPNPLFVSWVNGL